MRDGGRRGAGVIRAAAVAALLLGRALPGGGAVPGSGGIRIDGVLVPAERVWSEYHYQYAAKAMIHGKPADVVDEKLFAAVVEQVVGAELLEREALRLGPALPADAAAAVRAAEVKNWRGEEGFRTACRLLQVDEAFIVGRGLRQRRIEAMALAHSRAEEGLTDALLEEHYRAHRDAYLPKELPPLRYLFVPPGSPEDPDAMMRIAGEAHALSGRGDSFLPLVARYSKHPSAAAGGIVPERDPGGPGLPFQPAASRVKECRFVVEADAAGLHFYLRDCRQPLPIDQVRERVRGSLIGERRRSWTRSLLDSLRQAARIEFLAGPPPPRTVSPGAPGRAGH